MSFTTFVLKNSYDVEEYTDSGLLFLAHHSTADAKLLGFPILKSGTAAYDVPATLTLVNNPDGQNVTIKVVPNNDQAASKVGDFTFKNQYSFYSSEYILRRACH